MLLNNKEKQKFLWGLFANDVHLTSQPTFFQDKEELKIPIPYGQKFYEKSLDDGSERACLKLI